MNSRAGLGFGPESGRGLESSTTAEQTLSTRNDRRYLGRGGAIASPGVRPRQVTPDPAGRLGPVPSDERESQWTRYSV